MSLYYEAATILSNPDTGSFKSQIFGKKNLKSNPGALYALVSQTSKWSTVLKDVVEKSGILREEKKLTPALAILLTHDLILSKGGVAAPTNHTLKLAITRHKARLNAEFTKARVKKGFATVDAFRDHIERESLAAKSQGSPHPRWIRVNALRTSVDEQLKTTFAGYQKKSLEEVCAAIGTDKVLHIDDHIPDLLALPPTADFTKSKAYLDGQLILQDKASCFPAYLVAADAADDRIVDACSAPGNKTTHLAACLWKNRQGSRSNGKVFAFEKDEFRSRTLRKMTKIAGADAVSITAPQDFLEVDPHSGDMSTVTALLLDPSCSGSGIVGRDDAIRIVLPEVQSEASQAPRGKKRKRNPSKAPEQDKSTESEKKEQSRTSNGTIAVAEVDEVLPEQEDSSLKARLELLSTFQRRLLQHAMSFPSARRISYSTCSIHFEENESVVFHVLASPVARERGWRIMRRDEQPDGLKRWHVRGEMSPESEDTIKDVIGDNSDKKWINEVLDGVIRCEKGTKEGTMGFFVAGFVRDDAAAEKGTAQPSADHGIAPDGSSEDEWSGFSDDE